MRGELKGLGIALGDEAGTLVAVVAEEVLHREVGELQAGFTHYARLSPTGRNFDLVAAFGDEGISDVDGSGGFVGTNVFVEFALEHFRVELVHGGEFTHRTREGIHGEEIAGLGAKFAADDVIVDAVVAGDTNAVVSGLTSFAHANFEVDTVFVYFDFDGIGTEEDVTVVVILVADGVFVGIESLVEERLVVDVALFHAQSGFECLRGIDGVAHPGDIAEVVARALVEVDVDIDVLVVVSHDAVAEHHGVAITPTVHLLDEQALVFLILFGEEFARREGDPLFEGGAVAGLLHRVFQRCDHFGIDTSDVDFVDGDFVALVDIDVHNHAVVGRDIFVLRDVDLDVFVTLLLEILFDAQFGSIDEVGGDLVAGFEGNSGFDFLALRLFKSGESHRRNARLGGEFDVEIDFVSDDAVGENLHVGEESLLPIVLNGGADFVAGNLVCFSHFEVGNADEQIFIVALDAVDLNAPEHIACGLCGVDDVGLRLRLRAQRCGKCGSAEEQERIVQIFHKREGVRWGSGRRQCAAVLGLGHLFRGFAESAFAVLIVGDGAVQLFGGEIGPEDVGEIEFAVGTLPQEEIAQPELASGANEEFGVGHEVGFERSLHGLFVDVFGAELSVGHLSGEFAHGGGHLPAGGVRKGEHHRHAGVGGGVLLTAVECAANEIGQKRAITDDTQADVVGHEEFFLETVDDERHECGDFSLGSTPVFGRKGVEGEKLHPEV